MTTKGTYSIGMKQETREALEEIRIKNARAIRRLNNKKDFEQITADDLMNYLIKVHDDYEVTQYFEELTNEPAKDFEEPENPTNSPLETEDSTSISTGNPNVY